MRLIFWEDEPSEKTPIDSDNLNLVTNYAYVKKANLAAGEIIAQNTDLVIPIYYKVGDGVLDVYYYGTRLQKDLEYIEVGNLDSNSNRIQLKDWSAPVNSKFQFEVKGEYSNE